MSGAEQPRRTAVSGEEGDGPVRDLVAYYGGPRPPAFPEMAPSPRWREWMDATPLRFANRCLPLLMANESGWVVRNPAPFEACWDGGTSEGAIRVEYGPGCPPAKQLADSVFGHGILTFTVPYLFRTPEGFNLLARGPVNDPKDGIGALEGLVETDWVSTTFTMNWRFTRADHMVRFEEGEPYCLIVPSRRGDLEEFVPSLVPLVADPDAADRADRWQARRENLRMRKFLARYSEDFASAREEWEADYFRGQDIDGTKFSEHQTKRRLGEFSAEE